MRRILLLLAVLVSFNSFGDSGECDDTCFSTELMPLGETEDGCYAYELTVSYNGNCTAALSNFTAEVACGSISSLTNSGGWAQEIGNTDPNTGLTGFKIDNISNFGEEEGSGSFTINITLCPDSLSCNDKIACWSPVVAYKAGQCINYDTLSASCTNLTAELLINNPSCGGESDGSISLNIIDGKAPFYISWSTGDTTNSITNLGEGYYFVGISDANGDTLSLDATLTAPNSIILNDSVTNASCPGIDDGGITVLASGGSGNLSYSWSTGDTTASISNLSAGLYTVMVFDTTGCNIQKSYNVINTQNLSISAEITKSSCSADDGAIDITVDGSSDYNVQWLDGDTTEDRSNLAVGFYTVTASTTSGCSATRTFSVRENNNLALSGTIIPTGCPEDSTGGVNVAISGNTGPVTYLWSTGSTAANLQNVPAGRYDLTVTDSAGCSVSRSFNIFRRPLEIESVVNQPTCPGASDGSISITSVDSLTYEWSTGDTTSNIENLGAGIFFVTATSEAGCSSVFTYVLNEPAPIEASPVIMDIYCDSTTYSLQILPTGGTAPYSIIWADSVEGDFRENLTPGVYDYTIVDTLGCSSAGSVEVGPEVAVCPENPPTNPDDETGDETGGDGTNDGADNGNDSPDNPEDDHGDSTDDNDGSDDDSNGDDGSGGSGDDGNDEGINDCLNPYTTKFEVEYMDGCLLATGTVNYNGNKTFGLSHLTFSTSCGSIEGIDSETGIFEYGEDPTTSLDGLKIDNITGFGESTTTESFKFTFKICETECLNDTSLYFEVAYKYGQCVALESATTDISRVTSTSIFEENSSITAFPNPAVNELYFDLPQNLTGVSKVYLYNLSGKVVLEGILSKDENMISVKELPDNFYTYIIHNERGRYYGKVLITK